MSFGMLFSIILIVVILATAFFVINHFLGLQKCTDTGFLYTGLQEEVDKAWKSSSYQDLFSAKVPSGIDFVCFGNMTQLASNSEDNKKQNELENELYNPDHNVFLYPVIEACSSDLASYKLDHANITQFFCIEEREGKI